MAWLAGWDKRIELKIEDYAGDIGAEVIWFPATVFLTSSQCEEVFVELTTDAEYLKVAFTKADGETELYAECELFDVSEEKGIYHVSRDGWTINANTSIYMYYDADHADNTDYIGYHNTTPAEAVWDGNFKAVYHMKDGASTSAIYDSTSNDNDGTKIGANEPLETTSGKVGNAQYFDGANDCITIPSFTLDNSTVEIIVNPDDFVNYPTMFCLVNSGNPTYQFRFEENGTHIYLVFGDDEGDGLIINVAHGISAGTFHYIVGAVDGTTAKVYVDTVEKGSDTEASFGLQTFVADFTIGKDDRDNYEFDGIIDEFRISNVARGTAWLKGTYNSLWDTLFTYGSEETLVRVNALFFGANF